MKSFTFTLLGYVFSFSIVKKDAHIDDIVNTIFTSNALESVKKMKEYYHIDLKSAKERFDQIKKINFEYDTPIYEYLMSRKEAYRYLYETLYHFDRKN